MARIGIGIAAVAGILGLLAAGTAVRADTGPATDTPVYSIDNYPFQNAAALRQWRSVLAREAEQEARWTGDTCKNGMPRLDCAAKEAHRLEDELRDRSPVEQISAVYSYFNGFHYKEHGSGCTEDCWATRLQFLVQHEGDCGDHALAEYFTLRRLGFKERDLQLIVAQLPGNEDSFRGGHVVLRVFAASHYYILDNRRTDLTGLSGLRKYKVLAGLNADSVQIYNLVSDVPPPGFMTKATQVADLLNSPSAESLAPSGATKAANKKKTAAEQTLLASADQASSGDATAGGADSGTDSSGDCIQEARSLADWNPYLLCIPKIPEELPQPVAAIKPVSVKPAAQKTVKTIVVAEAVPARAPARLLEIPPLTDAALSDGSGCIQNAKLSDWNPNLPCGTTKKTKRAAAKSSQKKAHLVQSAKAAKPRIVVARVDGVPTAKATAKKAADPQDCMQGAKLGSWNPNLPCTPVKNAYRIRVKVKSESLAATTD